MQRLSRSLTGGFTLLELLVVMAIIGILASVSVPALNSLATSGVTNQAIASLEGTYELARTYAMSNHTYVRVGMAAIPAGSTVSLPTVVVMVIASADGSLASDTSMAMADNSQWMTVTKPLILSNLWTYNTLNSSNPDTSKDLEPSSTDITSFSRSVGSMGSPSFSAIVQFNPSGEARVLKSEAARYIKIGVDQPQQISNPGVGRNRNPFVIRLSGLNGSISVLRKEDLN